MRLQLQRISNSLEATLGVLTDISTGLPICLTLELPWKDNMTSLSCIPKGLYKVEKYSSDKYKHVFKILNVPSRTNVLIHVGNTADDTQGCILLGSQFGELKDKIAVLNSRGSLDLLKKYVDNKPFELEII